MKTTWVLFKLFLCMLAPQLSWAHVKCSEVYVNKIPFFIEGRWFNLDARSIKAYGDVNTQNFGMVISSPREYITTKLPVKFIETEMQQHFFHLAKNFPSRLNDYRVFGRLQDVDGTWTLVVERMWIRSEWMDIDLDSEVVYLDF